MIIPNYDRVMLGLMRQVRQVARPKWQYTLPLGHAMDTGWIDTAPRPVIVPQDNIYRVLNAAGITMYRVGGVYAMRPTVRNAAVGYVRINHIALEYLHSISVADALASGVWALPFSLTLRPNYVWEHREAATRYATPRDAFRAMWDATHPAHDAWDSDPDRLVFVYRIAYVKDTTNGS